MLILAYCAIKDESLPDNLGGAEYSYYFVYRQFVKALSKAYLVVAVEGNVDLLDAYHQNCLTRGETCFCLFFSQPHKIPTNPDCPIIPVFAWEFDSLPNAFNTNLEMDWGWRLAKHGWAITHSQYSVNCVETRLRKGFPVVSIPAPVWDDYRSTIDAKERLPRQSFSLLCPNSLIDSATLDLNRFHPAGWKTAFNAMVDDDASEKDHTLSISGVVYLSVFNPFDLRKNWQDLLKAFCWEFKRTADATLILKITHKEAVQILPAFVREMYKLAPFACRVVVLYGYLENDVYTALVTHCDYVVNSSHGEGQCLPLMEGMSAGKPAISPDHTAMRDYINAENAFVVGSSLEPAFWPHDPRRRLQALQYRIDWHSLRIALRQSYRLKKEQPEAYRRMSRCACSTMKRHCSRKTLLRRIKPFLESRRREYKLFDPRWRSRTSSWTTHLRKMVRTTKRKVHRVMDAARIAW